MNCADATRSARMLPFTARCARLILLLVLLQVSHAGVAQDLCVADFESSSYDGWTVTGAAFGPGPATGALPNQNTVAGFLGQKLVNTFHDGDAATGTLTSPPFTVRRKHIRFLIGGGNHRGKTCLNLLINGRVVRSAVGANLERLDWLQWNVAEFAGRSARIQIVDQSTSGWGHINVDHIVQTDQSLPSVVIPRKRYLNFPVRTGAPKRTFELLDEGLVLHEFNLELAESNPEFYVFLDLAALQGKELTARLDFQLADTNRLAVLVQSDTILGGETIYAEPHRPIYHFTARRGWLNDPNGLVFYKGEYHLFYQHNPYGWKWDNMHWGHAVSTNLVHWQELAEALHPDYLGAMWSGSTVVDRRNTAGFGPEALVACYTAAGGPSGVLPRMSANESFTQCLAYSLDAGRSWTKYTNNPVLPNVLGDNRDPKIIWHAPDHKWVMVLWLDANDFGFFSSTNLIDWQQTSTFTFPNVIEVPELFQLPLDGNTNDLRWVFYAGAGSYFLGSFDGESFTPQSGPFSIRGGNCFAATQTFSDIPPADGRRILIVHGTAQFPGMPFNNNMNFPVELTLATTESGPRLLVNPVRELALLRVSTNAWPEQSVVRGTDPLSGTLGEAFELDVSFRPGAAAKVSFNLRGTEVVYDHSAKQLICGNNARPLSPSNGVVRLQMLVDRGIVEIFANQGRVYMPVRVRPQAGRLPVGISVSGIGAQLVSARMHDLGSAWPSSCR